MSRLIANMRTTAFLANAFQAAGSSAASGVNEEGRSFLRHRGSAAASSTQDHGEMADAATAEVDAEDHTEPKVEWQPKRDHDLNVQRTALLARGESVEHVGGKQVEIVHNPEFKIANTIFPAIATSGVKTKMVEAKVGWKAQWAKEHMEKIDEEDRKGLESVTETCLQQPDRWNPDALQVLKTELVRKGYNSPCPEFSLTEPGWKELDEFMNNKCNFRMEHADGNFLEHLQFCRDYSARHMPQHSPKILYLHSICGVGTNIWPIPKDDDFTEDLLSELKQLLSPEEFKHVAAFPTVLRLLKGTDFLTQLFHYTHPDREQVKSITFKRLLGQKDIEFSIEEMWLHLNFHLIHTLDFLPVAGWQANANDIFLNEFAELYNVLLIRGKQEKRPDSKPAIQAPDQLIKKFEDDDVNASFKSYEYEGALPCWKKILPFGNSEAYEGLPCGFSYFLLRALPATIHRGLQTKTFIQLSKDAGVSL